MRDFNNEAKIIIQNYPYYHLNKDPFFVLISTILSQRTTDENTEIASNLLFSKYNNVQKMANAKEIDLYDLIKKAGMYKQKSKRIIETSKEIIKRFNGKVPDNMEDLISLPGVGRKTANVVLYVAFNKNALAVDTHVHRISNRLNWINTKTPDESELELMKILNKELWGPVNGSMVAFGKKTCRPQKPKCFECPLNNICPSSNI